MVVWRQYVQCYFNKNTRTLGAGDYPALKVFFILKVHEKVNFLAFTIDWIEFDVCSQTRGLRVRQYAR